MSNRANETIDLDSTDDKSGTINLDSSTDDNLSPEKPREFVPVKPGGKKLDDTVELSDSDDEQGEQSHYVSCVQESKMDPVVDSKVMTSSEVDKSVSESPLVLGRPLPEGAVTSTPAQSNRQNLMQNKGNKNNVQQIVASFNKID